MLSLLIAAAAVALFAALVAAALAVFGDLASISVLATALVFAVPLDCCCSCCCYCGSADVALFLFRCVRSHCTIFIGLHGEFHKIPVH